MTTIVHLISEYSTHEAMGRTVTETALRVPGQHHLITTRLHDGGEAFASVHELGGDITTFPMKNATSLHEILTELKPDVVHFHSGILGPFLADRAGLHPYPLLFTIYAWPNLPGKAAWKHAGWSSLRSSNVLPNRVAVTAMTPSFLIRRAIKKLAPLGILSPDPRVVERLQGLGVPVEILPSGAPTDDRRAQYLPSGDTVPTVVFAGRAENVRGVTTLIDAFPQVLHSVPTARLKLLLLPRPELSHIQKHAENSSAASSIDIITDPIPDLLQELSTAQVGAWPFLADYTTSPPAMAIAEAMSVGLPVVSTPVACVRSVMRPNIDGIATAPGDSSALAAAIISLLTNESTWNQYAENGLAATRRLTWDNMAETTERMYAEKENNRALSVSVTRA